MPAPAWTAPGVAHVPSLPRAWSAAVVFLTARTARSNLTMRVVACRGVWVSQEETASLLAAHGFLDARLLPAQFQKRLLIAIDHRLFREQRFHVSRA